MTPERQNEIWAMLDAEAQKEVREMYVNALIVSVFNQGYTTHGMRLSTLEELFGKHNLTTKAEEKPKAPNCTNHTESTISDSKIQPESAESVETDTKEDAYFNYRLDLAKEIAVAMVHVFNQAYQDIPEDAVTITNEIVKRLKETAI